MRSKVHSKPPSPTIETSHGPLGGGGHGTGAIPVHIADAIVAYWNARAYQFSPATIDDYTRSFKRLAAFLSEHNKTQLDTLSPATLQEFLSHLKTHHKLGPKTLRNVWIALSSLFTWLATTYDIPSPMMSVPAPKHTPHQPTPYTEDELKRLLAATKTNAPWRTKTTTVSRRPTATRDTAIILLLVDTGLRASELCALQVQDYDPATGRITIRHGKGNKQRTVYAGAKTREALRRYMTRRQQTLWQRDRRHLEPHQPLFATRTETRLTRDHLLHLIKVLARNAKITGANVHRFRHTFAIQFLANGGNAFALQDLLGHTDLTMVRRYVRYAQVDLIAAMRNASPVDNMRL